MEIVHRLQDGVGIGIGDITSTCIGAGIGTCSGIGTGGSIGIGVGAKGMDHFLTTDGLVMFRDKIYVSNNIELTKVTLMEFHAKPYLGHPGYHKTLTTVNIFHFWPNLKRDLVEFVSRCFNYEHVKAECKHLGGTLQLILILESTLR